MRVLERCRDPSAGQLPYFQSLGALDESCVEFAATAWLPCALSRSRELLGAGGGDSWVRHWPGMVNSLAPAQIYSAVLTVSFNCFKPEFSYQYTV